MVTLRQSTRCGSTNKLYLERTTIVSESLGGWSATLTESRYVRVARFGYTESPRNGVRGDQERLSPIGTCGRNSFRLPVIRPESMPRAEIISGKPTFHY